MRRTQLQAGAVLATLLLLAGGLAFLATQSARAQYPQTDTARATQRPPAQSGQGGLTPSSVASGLLTAAQPGVPFTLLYDQFNNITNTGTNSQYYEAAVASVRDYLADDFVVP